MLAICTACAPHQADMAPDGQTRQADVAPDGQTRQAAGAQSPSATIWQLSPLTLLEQGNFNGVVTAAEVRRHGDLGVGAADSLDGELAVVNGNFFQFMAGGRVQRSAPSLRLPFASVTAWEGGTSLRLPPDLFPAPLQNAIDARLPTTNAFYALRLTGRWRLVQGRTFKKQKEPYDSITPAMADTFSFTDVRGVMVGFRQPSYVGSLSVPNYHLHFLNEDSTYGGHVRGFIADSVVLEFSIRPNFTLHIPPVKVPGNPVP
jgi:alpha-acetolactate decarboxylase